MSRTKMTKKNSNEKWPLSNGLVSLFCGAGGLDLGFEQERFSVDLAVDIREASVRSYNHNRLIAAGRTVDVSKATVLSLDRLARKQLAPIGIIGGPPCQSFTQATHNLDNDPRHDLPLQFVRLLRAFNRRSPVSFFVLENVPGLTKKRHEKRFKKFLNAFDRAGFNVFHTMLNASSFGVPQDRSRLILAGFNKALLPHAEWCIPKGSRKPLRTVRSSIGHLPEPVFWEKGLDSNDIPLHPNHWCMVPRSRKFTTPGVLVPGTSRGRSFRTLSWDAPSPTIAYGNREVHVHPSCKRRLSVYESLLLQGFPTTYELVGSLSAQISQVSEAVPPPLAKVIAKSIYRTMAEAGVDCRMAA